MSTFIHKKKKNCMALYFSRSSSESLKWVVMGASTQVKYAYI